MTAMRGMILAAGLGLRMRPLTETVPKPLLRLRGRALLDLALDRLRAAGIAPIVVNAHHLADQVAAHLAGAPDVILSREAELLETGGGVLAALPHLGAEPFVAVNADTVWLDGATPALDRLRAAWDPERMDALLLLARSVTAVGHHGPGDFHMDQLGRLARRGLREVAPFVFAGVQILHPRLFAPEDEGRFSLNRLYDRALAAGRLRGLAHDGPWLHLGTPADLADAEAWLDDNRIALG